MNTKSVKRYSKCCCRKCNNKCCKKSCREKICEEGLKELRCSKYRLVVDEKEDTISVFNCKSGCKVDLFDLPGDFCEEWNGSVGDLGARAFAKDSTKLTAENASKLELKYKTFVPVRPNQTLDTNQSITVVQDMIYITTQNNSNFVAPRFGDFSGNYVLGIRRKDGKIMWQRDFGDYTGIPGDLTRGAPNVIGDYMWMLASGVFFGFQSTADPDDPSKDLNLKLFGSIPYKGIGERLCAAVCVNRHTGDLVWSKKYGKVATNYNDPDNFRNFGFNGTTVEIDVSGTGTKIPVLIAGTNYVGQYAYNALLFSERPGTIISVGLQRRLKSYQNQGELMFINGLTGDVIKEVPLGPRNLEAGEKINKPGAVDYEEIRDPFIPGHDSVQVRENIEVGPLPSGPTFNYDIDGGNWTCVTLNKDAAVLGNSEFRDTVPDFLNGVQATNNVGTIVTLTAGETVLANPTYHEMNIRANIKWVPGFVGDRFTVEGHVPANQEFTVADSLIGLRISKNLLDGHVLTENDGYELRYTGPSAWAAPVAINHDSNGVPVEAYLATGQGHRCPYDESLYFDSRYSSNVPADSNYNQRQQSIYDASQTGDISLIRAAENNTVDLVRQRVDIANTKISPRGKMYLIDAVAAFDLRPSNFGNLIWSYRTLGFDTWQSPQSASTFPNAGYSRSLEIPNGFVEGSNYWEQPTGLDGDMGQRACLVKEKYGKKDKLVWANKQGHAGVIELSNVNFGKSNPSTKVWRYLGPASILGGANYGSAVDNTTLYTAQRNCNNEGFNPLPNSDNFANSYSYFPHVNDVNPPTPLVEWTIGNQYVSAMDLETGNIKWETPLAPLQNYARAVAAASRGSGAACSPGIVFVQARDNKLRGFDSKTGEIVFETESEAGNSWVGIADNEVYAWIGRANGGTVTQFLRVYALNKC